MSGQLVARLEHVGFEANAAEPQPTSCPQSIHTATVHCAALHVLLRPHLGGLPTSHQLVARLKHGGFEANAAEPQPTSCPQSIHTATVHCAALHVLLRPHVGGLPASSQLVARLEHVALEAIAAVHAVPVAPGSDVVAIHWWPHPTPEPAVRGHLLHVTLDSGTPSPEYGHKYQKIRSARFSDKVNTASHVCIRGASVHRQSGLGVKSLCNSLSLDLRPHNVVL